MQEVNRSRIEIIGDFSRYSLIGLLVINILASFAILFINAEGFFLGQKIAGTPADVYAVGLILVTAFLMFCLYKKTKGYAIIALVYGIIWFIDGFLTVLYYNNQVPPALYWLVLLLSVMLFCTTLAGKSGKPTESYGKSVFAIFSEKPRTGLLLSAVVLLCFLILTSISMMTDEHETNDYLYAVEIIPDTPLHNITLMMPLPSAISRNIAEGDDRGNPFPYFRNYSQSVVETENGTMLKITADSIEKPGEGLPQEPAGLYLDFFTENPVNYSYPLETEPLLVQKFSPKRSVCADKKFRRHLTGNTPLICLVHESALYAVFETAPGSRTSITVSLDGTRMVSSSGSPKNHGYQDSVSITVSGNASGWYSATGSLLAG